jgi:hypothetical protein
MRSVRFLRDIAVRFLRGIAANSDGRRIAMKLGRLLASLLFSLALLGGTYAQDAATGSWPKLRGFSMSHKFSYNGFTYTYHLSTSDIAHTPSWNPLKGEPPVSLRKALEIATVNLHRFVKDADGWDVSHIDLKQMDTGKWIYEISFGCIHRGCINQTGSDFPILLKMDGSVVEPEVTPSRQAHK